MDITLDDRNSFVITKIDNSENLFEVEREVLAVLSTKYLPEKMSDESEISFMAEFKGTSTRLMEESAIGSESEIGEGVVVTYSFLSDVYESISEE